MSGDLRAIDLGLVSCDACGLLCRHGHRRGQGYCPRCGAWLCPRRRHSLMQSWALLIAAALLYIPANLLPMMQTETLFSARHDTIVSGVIVLWQEGAHDLAIIVFVASVVVPLLKIGVLALLLVTAQMRSTWRQAERAGLYRFIERIGHWSMLDIFVVALLVALVDFQNVAQVRPGSGTLAFGAVVVLTMLATMRFDPRLIWDTPRPEPRS